MKLSLSLLAGLTVPVLSNPHWHRQKPDCNTSKLSSEAANSASMNSNPAWAAPTPSSSSAVTTPGFNMSTAFRPPMLTLPGANRGGYPPTNIAPNTSPTVYVSTLNPMPSSIQATGPVMVSDNMTSSMTGTSPASSSFIPPKPTIPVGDRPGYPTSNSSFEPPPLSFTTEVNHVVPYPTPSPSQLETTEAATCIPTVWVTETQSVTMHTNSMVTTTCNSENTLRPRALKEVLTDATRSVTFEHLSPTKKSDTSMQPTKTSMPWANSAFKNKRGIIGMRNITDVLASQIGRYSKVSWYGNSFAAAPKHLSSNLAFVPQFNNKTSDSKGDWTHNANLAVASHGKERFFLSFNEPATSKGNLALSPQDAAKLWTSKLEPYAKKGISIGSPGLTANAIDLTWLSNFRKYCSKCTVGFLTVHWFGQLGDSIAKIDDAVKDFQNTVEEALSVAQTAGINRTRLPVWIDRFQATGSSDAQARFLSKTLPWLDQLSGVTAYAYVPLDSTQDLQGGSTSAGFVTSQGVLSNLGKFYASL